MACAPYFVFPLHLSTLSLAFPRPTDKPFWRTLSPQDELRNPLRVSALACASALAGSSAMAATSSRRPAAASAGLIAFVNRAVSPFEPCAEFLDFLNIGKRMATLHGKVG